jgi:hypothetical protein
VPLADLKSGLNPGTNKDLDVTIPITPVFKLYKSICKLNGQQLKQLRISSAH